MGKKYDVIVIGAGASGLMAALRAGQRGRTVLVLDHAPHAGAKVRISGGGRCNFTNREARADRYLSQNPHFCISALKSFSPSDFEALVEKHKITYHEKTQGQLFCDTSSRSIVDMLLAECAAGGVTFGLGKLVRDVEKDENFLIKTDNETYEGASLVVATGGLSIPKLGATDFAYRMAKKFDLPLIETRPALVPFVFEGRERALFENLSGVSLEVEASCGKKTFREKMIFTHRGLSGPAILQISSYWRDGMSIRLNLLPDRAVETFLLDRKKERPKVQIKTVLSEVLPQRLAQALQETYFTAKPLAEWTNNNLKEAAAHLTSWELTPSGTEGYAKAEVTLGGIDTRAFSSKTMECTCVSGLYCVGEALDVTGWLGGYNLQWAWSSGWAAGSAA